MIACANRGFTLLEMVVVLVIMGIITTLVAPRLQRMYDSMEASLARNEIEAALERLVVEVRNSGKPLIFKNYPDDELILPKSFTKTLSQLSVSLEFDEPLNISPSGFCSSAGSLTVTKSSLKYRLYVRSPDCRIMRE